MMLYNLNEAQLIALRYIFSYGHLRVGQYMTGMTARALRMRGLVEQADILPRNLPPAYTITEQGRDFMISHTLNQIVCRMRDLGVEADEINAWSDQWIKRQPISSAEQMALRGRLRKESIYPIPLKETHHEEE